MELLQKLENIVEARGLQKAEALLSQVQGEMERVEEGLTAFLAKPSLLRPSCCCD